MKVTPAKGRMPTAKELHQRRCFLLGIDPVKWPTLWAQEQERIKKATEKRVPQRAVRTRKRSR